MVGKELFLKVGLHNCTALACVTVFVVLVSCTAGGWNIILKSGTAYHRCNQSYTHPEGKDRFLGVCVGGGTEAAFTGVYDKHYPNTSSTYRCACCGEPLFPAATKFNSRSGWPSFTAPVDGDAVGYKKDQVYSVEVHCKRCGAHLGHVFDDGEGKTGYRYCINSVCLSYDDSLALAVEEDVPWVLNAYLLLAVVIVGVFYAGLLLVRLVTVLRRIYNVGWKRSTASLQPE
eukprot:TRINITY_DN12260_c0_g3_i1.p1 TRINITY_DN12260_c0_g3~~TRINITY_DN12260_c0_g3_i1.p1  ORF type:complete len:230 (-),score=18.16 TRINITY_DN12260_c0_g3_i1:26-715(-)